MADLTLAIVVTVLVTYALILLVLNRAKVLERLNIETIIGFILLWRTKRGRKFIHWLARPKRFWAFWGDLSIVMVVIAGTSAYLLLLWEAVLVTMIPPELAPGPEMLIGIPGLNPIIPLWYGIFGLAVAIIWHEFSHGILTRLARVRIRSMGVIAIIIPVGAFVEPDEEALAKLPRKKRARVYAAGPMANIILAFVCALIFSFAFMGSVEPVKDGMVVKAVTKGMPAEEAGIRPWMLITGVSTVNFTADDLVTTDDFNDAMVRSKAGEVMNVTYYFEGRFSSVQVTLADKYEYFSEYYPDPDPEVAEILETFKGVGFLGVTTMSLREDVIEAQARPLKDASSAWEVFEKGLIYVSMPIVRMSPMPDELSSLVVVKGPLSVLPTDAFWVLANAFYWMFWLNFMLGATNALPAKPLDGGHMTHDGISKLLGRLRPRWSKEKAHKVSGKITLAFSLSTLFLIIWLVAGPWVSAGLRSLVGM